MDTASLGELMSVSKHKTLMLPKKNKIMDYTLGKLELPFFGSKKEHPYACFSDQGHQGPGVQWLYLIKWGFFY